jgi:hypothetical protein
MSPTTTLGETVWELPPLILHPFNERIPPSALLENSKAALMLSGMIPGDGTDPADLKRRLMRGRYSEMRMLFFLGKDVMRWMDQCMEWAERVPELAGAGDLCAQSFAGLLTWTCQREADSLGRGRLCLDLCAGHRDERCVCRPAADRSPLGGVSARLPSLCGLSVPLLYGIADAPRDRAGELPV